LQNRLNVSGINNFFEVTVRHFGEDNLFIFTVSRHSRYTTRRRVAANAGIRQVDDPLGVIPIFCSLLCHLRRLQSRASVQLRTHMQRSLVRSSLLF
jgi:hypothetical protein